MRRFIRHPVDVPLDVSIENLHPNSTKIVNVCEGGLCFFSNSALPDNCQIKLAFPTQFDTFYAEAIVSWTKRQAKGFLIGVNFCDPETQFGVKMVEQVYSIENYRHEVLTKEGRNINNEQAAKEWVAKYAEKFSA